MSSMRNAVYRRNHRERAQPLERQKWGLLEKNKDYKLRARDHKEKVARLRRLRQKAADRNPDEFSFGMLRSRVANDTGGKLVSRGNQSLSMETVRLLKTQDAGYIRTALAGTRKEKERLEQEYRVSKEASTGLRRAELSARGERSSRSHKAFVESVEEQRVFRPERWSSNGGNEQSEVAAPLPSDEIRSESEDEWEGMDSEADDGDDERLETRRRRLEHLKKQEEALIQAEEELHVQRAKINHNVGGVNKNGVKFRIRQRKK